MGRDDGDPMVVAEAWLAAQRGLLESLREGSGTAAFAAWAEAMGRCTAAMADAAPPSLAPLLRASLDHARAWYRVASEVESAGASPGMLALTLLPEQMAAAAREAFAARDGASGEPDAEELRRFAETMELLSRTAAAGLEAMHDRLAGCGPLTPSESIDLCLEALEASHRALAAGGTGRRASGDGGR